MRKLEQYRVREGITPLSGPELSRRFFDIDGRLHQLEQLKVSWAEAVAEVQEHGLERINSVIQPMLDQAQALVDGLQQDIDDITAEWQGIQDGWAAMQAAMNELSTAQHDLEASLAATRGELAGLHPLRTVHGAALLRLYG